MDRPSFLDNKFVQILDKTKSKFLNFSGKSKTGGLTGTPFGSSILNAFWTIKGDNFKSPRYECGSNHKNDNLLNINSNMVMTHHTIWYRGEAVSEDDHRDRYIKISKKK